MIEQLKGISPRHFFFKNVDQPHQHDNSKTKQHLFLPPTLQLEGVTDMIGFKVEKNLQDAPSAKAAFPLPAIQTFILRFPAGVCGEGVQVISVSEAAITVQSAFLIFTVTSSTLAENPLPVMTTSDPPKFEESK